MKQATNRQQYGLDALQWQLHLQVALFHQLSKHQWIWLGLFLALGIIFASSAFFEPGLWALATFPLLVYLAYPHLQQIDQEILVLRRAYFSAPFVQQPAQGVNKEVVWVGYFFGRYLGEIRRRKLVNLLFAPLLQLLSIGLFMAHVEQISMTDMLCLSGMGLFTGFTILSNFQRYSITLVELSKPLQLPGAASSHEDFAGESGISRIRLGY